LINDRISKPATGRYFAASAPEIIELVGTLPFKTGYSGKRPAIHMENCKVDCEFGYQLCSFFRERYIAIFSLPEHIPQTITGRALKVAIEQFAVFDQGPHLSVRDQQFVIYRAYLGDLGKVTLTQHIVNGGFRSYLQFDSASQLSKSELPTKSERKLQSLSLTL